MTSSVATVVADLVDTDVSDTTTMTVVVSVAVADDVASVVASSVTVVGGGFRQLHA